MSHEYDGSHTTDQSYHDKTPRWRKATAEVVMAVIALSTITASPSSAEVVDPTPTPTVTPEVTEPTATPTTSVPVIETTVKQYTVRTANVTGKHMDGFTGNGYNKRPYYGTWAERRGILVNDLSVYHPKVLGLQEVDPGSQSTYIHDVLEHRGYETKESNYSTNSRPIYWDDDTFDLVKGATFDLGDADHRRATYAILKDRLTEQEILFINAHYESSLDSAGDKARMKSATTVALLADTLSQNGKIPTIFMGDHNSAKYTNPYYITTGQCTYAKRSNGCYSKAKSYGLASKIGDITPLADATSVSGATLVNYKYDTNNGYYKYDCTGSHTSHCSHRVIDHIYLDRVNSDGMVKMDVTKVWNDLPTIRNTSAHGNVRSTDHNPNTAYINMTTKKVVLQ